MKRFSYARGRIEETLQFIAQEMEEFDREYGDKTYQDYYSDRKLQKLMDKTVEDILTALIELSGTLLVQKGKRVESYRQILREAALVYGLGNKKAEELSHLAIERNRIVHRYLDIRWDSIREYRERIPLIREFLRRVWQERKDGLSGNS